MAHAGKVNIFLLEKNNLIVATLIADFLTLEMEFNALIGLRCCCLWKRK